jgi:hypothetical protein
MGNNFKIEKAFFFIPDIGGFTRFLNETEILHSSHIIAELLEIIIRENVLNLEIAEIEGDAVFFYKKGNKPSLEKIFEQCKLMYFAFHRHLKLYARDRVCDCGACMHTSDLNLKFIIHHGDIIERKVFKRKQLMGLDVTLAHRLLKNNIDENEYLLFTKKNFSNQDQDSLPPWINLSSNNVFYDEIGSVDYCYSSLKPLRKEIPTLPERHNFEYVAKPVRHSIIIQANIDQVFDMITDVNLKPQYMIGLRRINYNMNQNNRIGSSHECILPFSKLNFELVEYENFSEKRYITEYSGGSFIIPPHYQKFIIECIDENSCKLITEIHFNTSAIKEFFAKRIMLFNVIQSMKKFRRICELGIEDVSRL